MKRPLQLVLGLVLGAVLTCALVALLGLTLFRSTVMAASSSVQAEPGEADRVAQAIAEITVPAGYTGAVAVQFADFDVAGYNGPDGHSHIYLFQLPPKWHVDQAELERQWETSLDDLGISAGPDMQVIAQDSVTIRGQATTLVTSEGDNGAGERIRSANAAFQGKDGQALVSFSGLAASWDTTMIEAFIAAMR